MKTFARWFSRQGRTTKVLVVLAVILVPLALIGALRNAVGAPAPVALLDSAPPSPTATMASGPEIRVVEETVTTAIPYESSTVDDPGSPAGTTTVRTAGVPGVLTQVFQVTFTDGIESERTLLSEVVTTAPVAEVIAVGSYIAPIAAPPPAAGGCDPNYTGCVPIDSDVDCAGGSGNGPSYAVGPVTVIGSDIYDLDRDGDGVACD